MCSFLLIIAVIIIFVLAVGLHQKSTNSICVSRCRLESKSVLVTGGTAGMGLEIAKDLAHRGARVIIACPFEDEGNAARSEIVKETDNTNVVFKYLDLSSLKSIREFAADILKNEERLDILINNAGVGIPKDCLTSDGMQYIMQVNYYGTFLLTLLLLSLLKKTGTRDDKSRIITTSSRLHLLGSLNIDKLNKTNNFLRVRVYAKSKICLVGFVRELARRLKDSDVVINNVDPGLVGTRIYNSADIITGTFIRMVLILLFKTPWEGAQTALHVALDKKAGFISGEYFKDCQITRFVRNSDDVVLKKLWDSSVKLVGLTDLELEQCFKSL